VEHVEGSSWKDFDVEEKLATAVSQQSCVVIGDGDAAAREQIVHILEGMGFDVRQAGTGVEALRLVRSGRPSAVLLDVALPEISGYQVCHMLRSEYGSELPILLLSSNRVESYDKTAGLLLGATDYLAKPFSPDELLARLKAHMRQSIARKPNGSDGDMLTPSELRVLRMLASGVHTKVIARELAITPKTVSVHIQNAMKKLEVPTRTQAVARAHQLGLVNGHAANGNGNGSHDEVHAHVAERPPPRRRQREPQRPAA
jgi:DNA-binding NarL/FixJ family response regulator